MLHERQREGKTEEEKADERGSGAGVARERWRSKRGPGSEEKVARRRKARGAGEDLSIDDVTFIPDWILEAAATKARFALEPRPSSPTSNGGCLGNTKRRSEPLKSAKIRRRSMKGTCSRAKILWWLSLFKFCLTQFCSQR